MFLRIDGILPRHYTVSQPEDRGSMVLRNVGILPHRYTLLQSRKSRFQESFLICIIYLLFRYFFRSSVPSLVPLVLSLIWFLFIQSSIYSFI